MVTRSSFFTFQRRSKGRGSRAQSLSDSSTHSLDKHHDKEKKVRQPPDLPHFLPCVIDAPLLTTSDYEVKRTKPKLLFVQNMQIERATVTLCRPSHAHFLYPTELLMPWEGEECLLSLKVISILMLPQIINIKRAVCIEKHPSWPLVPQSMFNQYLQVVQSFVPLIFYTQPYQMKHVALLALLAFPFNSIKRRSCNMASYQ